MITVPVALTQDQVHALLDLHASTDGQEVTPELEEAARALREALRKFGDRTLREASHG